MRAILHTVRYWGPLVVGFMCLVAALYTGALVGWLLIILGFGLIFDGTTTMWARAGSTGTMRSYRQ